MFSRKIRGGLNQFYSQQTSHLSPDAMSDNTIIIKKKTESKVRSH